MRISNLSPVFMFIVVILALVHVSSSRRHISWCCTSTEEVQGTKPRVRARFSFEVRRLSAGNSHSAGFRYKKMNQISAVAHQAVPGGPNPLHN